MNAGAGEDVVISYNTAEDASFFKRKVDDIRVETASTSSWHKASVSLDIFSPVCSKAISKLLDTRSGMTYSLDHLLSFRVKKHVGPILPFIVILFHKSFADGVFPEAFKNTIVKPCSRRLAWMDVI